jgi:hypothetical protein
VDRELLLQIRDAFVAETSRVSRILGIIHLESLAAFPLPGAGSTDDLIPLTTLEREFVEDLLQEKENPVCWPVGVAVQ